MVRLRLDCKGEHKSLISADYDNKDQVDDDDNDIMHLLERPPLKGAYVYVHKWVYCSEEYYQ